MRSGLKSSLLALLGAAGLALTQGPVRAESLPEGRPAGSTGVSYGSVMDADLPASPAPAGAPVKVSGPVPMDGAGDYTHAPTCLGAGCNGGYCGVQDNQFYSSFDFLLYRLTNTSAPPITVISPVGVIPIVSTNTVVTGGTVTTQANPQVNLPVAFTIAPGIGNGGQVDFGDIPGFRFNFGYWFDPQHCFGVEGSFFLTDRQDFDFSSAQGTTGPTLFPTGIASTITTVTLSGTTAAQTTTTIPITLLGSASSSLAGTMSSEMWGLQLNAMCGQCQFGGLRWSCLGGVRYINLNEDVTTSEQAALLGISLPTAPNAVATTQPIPNFVAGFFDHVATHDHFIGPQIGINYDWCLCHRVALEGFAKLAVGDMHEAFSLFGATTETSATGVTTTGSGLLVGPGESGAHRKRDRIAAVPEFQMDLSYYVTPRFRLYAGYDVLYFSTIARGGTSIALATTSATAVVGPTSTPITLASPVFSPVGNSLWIQGFNAGLEYRF